MSKLADDCKLIDAILDVAVADDEKAEACDIMVCLRADAGIDHYRLEKPEFGQCNDCGVAIQFSPTSPKRPVKICPQCLGPRLQGGRA